jgi:hypothetical protein
MSEYSISELGGFEERLCYGKFIYVNEIVLYGRASRPSSSRSRTFWSIRSELARAKVEAPPGHKRKDEP